MRIIKADLHNHFTHRSKILDVNRLADIVYQRGGNGAICALVNYDDKRFEAFADRAEKASPRATRIGNAVYFPDRNIYIVKGEEVPTQEGDLLVLATEEGIHLSQGQPLEYSLKEGEEKGGIPIITTPYFMSKVGKTIKNSPGLFAKSPIVIEVHNGEATKNANRQAYELYRWLKARLDNDVAAVVNSDGHSFREVFSSYTKFTVDDDLFKTTDMKEFTKQLRDTIRYASRTFHATHSRLGALEHSVVIGGIILASKVGIHISRGDREALR